MARRSGISLRALSGLKKSGLLLALVALLGLAALFLPQFSGESATRGGWSKTKPTINLTHIFEGEINRSGKPVGFHVAPKEPMGAKSRIRKVMSGPNRAGVYTAMVEIYDPGERRWKEKFSSFFPDDFSRQQVIDSILFALANNMLPKGARWRGPSGHGFLIEGYRYSSGDVNTAYPLYVADRGSHK
ncbi:EndoU domain-containing protein [Sneathiella sp.]|jgi:hypothetical protein|uniref:EndoU domain-containing protein n=1 Tax=Sneathiella sp. TaxID=1964365 RepID=UPI0025CEB76B|nr:EndoU domain-containing protein [Sneathiella sp.]|tara:strand:+ start:491 stop:1051 length:561 start_codon:yes stop_codon:yes gene_type:complete